MFSIPLQDDWMPSLTDQTSSALLSTTAPRVRLCLTEVQIQRGEAFLADAVGAKGRELEHSPFHAEIHPLPLPLLPARSKLHAELDQLKVLTSSTTQKDVAFWQSFATTLPLLAPVAHRFLSTPASSLSCERVFSAASAIVTKKRNQLKSDRISILVRSRHNLRTLTTLGVEDKIGYL